MPLREFNGKQPRFGQGVFVADDVSVIGDVEIGNDVSLWFGSVLRGDIHFIRVGSRTNIQDNCVLHVTAPTHPCVVGEEVTIGHAAIVHGCTVKRGALIGMGSRVLDGAVVGECALVAAGAVVSEGMVVPARMLVAGVPAKVKRPLTDAELDRLDMSWKHYVELKDRYLMDKAIRD
jgi:carbonic anhydrase/acetyltransferase-like protein (isoleucine patch superfamily)